MFILPLFIGMNLLEHADNTFSNMVFKGRYTDINAGWYEDVGYQIQIILLIFAFQPLIDLATEYSLLKLWRKYLKGRYYDDEKISATSKRNV
jgi:hypothetical protein